MAKRKNETAKQHELRLLQNRLTYAEKHGYTLKELPNFQNKTAKELHDIRGKKLITKYTTGVKELGYKEIPEDSQSTNRFSNIEAVERMLSTDIRPYVELRSKNTGKITSFSNVNEALSSILYDTINTYTDESVEAHLENYQTLLSSLINELNEAPYTEKYIKDLDSIARILNFNEPLSFSQKEILTDAQEQMGY